MDFLPHSAAINTSEIRGKPENPTIPEEGELLRTAGKGSQPEGDRFKKTPRLYADLREWEKSCVFERIKRIRRVFNLRNYSLRASLLIASPCEIR